MATVLSVSIGLSTGQHDDCEEEAEPILPNFKATEGVYPNLAITKLIHLLMREHDKGLPILECRSI